MTWGRPPRGPQSRDPTATVLLPSAKLVQVPPRALSPVTWALTGWGAGGVRAGGAGGSPQILQVPPSPWGHAAHRPLSPTCAGDIVAAWGQPHLWGQPDVLGHPEMQWGAQPGPVRLHLRCPPPPAPPGRLSLPKVTGTPRRDTPAMAAPASALGRMLRDMGDSAFSRRSPFWSLPTHISTDTTPPSTVHPIPRRGAATGCWAGGTMGPGVPPSPAAVPGRLPVPGTSRACPCSKGD